MKQPPHKLNWLSVRLLTGWFLVQVQGEAHTLPRGGLDCSSDVTTSGGQFYKTGPAGDHCPARELGRAYKFKGEEGCTFVVYALSGRKQAKPVRFRRCLCVLNAHRNTENLACTQSLVRFQTFPLAPA